MTSQIEIYFETNLKCMEDDTSQIIMSFAIKLKKNIKEINKK